MGHGMAAFFFVLGAAFLLLGLNEGFTSALEDNATCQPGSCAGGGVKMTFVILGVSFMGTATLASVITEFSIRKTTSIIGQVKTFSESGSPSDLEGITDFLKPFGITIDPSTNANVNVQQRTIDLRGQRSGDVPTDPAGFSAYLKAFGIAIDEEALENATVVLRGETVQAPPNGHSALVPAGTGGESGRRETATIVRKRDRGETAGSQRLVEFELEVMPAGKVPYRVEVASLVRESLAGLLIEGSTLNVRVDPQDDNRVTIDWSEN